MAEALAHWSLERKVTYISKGKFYRVSDRSLRQHQLQRVYHTHLYRQHYSVVDGYLLNPLHTHIQNLNVILKFKGIKNLSIFQKKKEEKKANSIAAKSSL